MTKILQILDPVELYLAYVLSSSSCRTPSRGVALTEAPCQRREGRRLVEELSSRVTITVSCKLRREKCRRLWRVICTPRTVYAQRRLAADYGGRDALRVSTDDRDDVKRVRIDLLVTVDYFPSPTTIGIARA